MGFSNLLIDDINILCFKWKVDWRKEEKISYAEILNRKHTTGGPPKIGIIFWRAGPLYTGLPLSPSVSVYQLM